MYWSDEDGTGTGSTAIWDWESDETGTACATTWYISSNTMSRTSSISIDLKALLAIAAAEKDRLHWTFKVVLFWLWEYIPTVILSALRLMFSLSGWLARAGKKRKSGN